MVVFLSVRSPEIAVVGATDVAVGQALLNSPNLKRTVNERGDTNPCPTGQTDHRRKEAHGGMRSTVTLRAFASCQG